MCAGDSNRHENEGDAYIRPGLSLYHLGRLKLWTADPRFAAVAKELGVGYEA